MRCTTSLSTQQWIFPQRTLSGEVELPTDNESNQSPGTAGREHITAEPESRKSRNAFRAIIGATINSYGAFLDKQKGPMYQKCQDKYLWNAGRTLLDVKSFMTQPRDPWLQRGSKSLLSADKNQSLGYEVCRINDTKGHYPQEFFYRTTHLHSCWRTWSEYSRE